MSTMPPDIRARVLADVKRRPSPDQRATQRSNQVATLLGVFTAIIMIATVGFSLGGRPLEFVSLSAIGWACIAAVATSIGGSRGTSMLGRTTIVLLIAALLVAPVVFGWVMTCTIGWPELRQPEGTWRQHIGCFVTTLLLSLGPVITLSFVRRRGDPVHPRAMGAAIGAAAGAWGGVLIDLHCPLVSPLHVAVAHVMPVLVYAAVGALVGSRLFGVSRER